jgi:hypothetical protein
LFSVWPWCWLAFLAQRAAPGGVGTIVVGMVVYLALHLGLVTRAGVPANRSSLTGIFAERHSFRISALGQGPVFSSVRPECAAQNDAGQITEDTRNGASTFCGVYPMALDAGAAVMVTSHLGAPPKFKTIGLLDSVAPPAWQNLLGRDARVVADCNVMRARSLGQYAGETATPC